MLPDGTTLLIDAGELDPTSPRVLSPRNTRRYPDYSKLGFQWQADYIKSVLPNGAACKIDYALITHYHDDHFGSFYPGMSKSSKGDYYLSGITGVGDIIPIRNLLDRGCTYPIDLKKAAKEKPASYLALANYWNYIDYNVKHNEMSHSEFMVGSDKQIVLLNNKAAYPDFKIRVINANGVVWGGGGNSPNITRMPTPEAVMNEKKRPDENTLSCGFMIQYGKFRFYTAADIHGPQPSYFNMPDWYDVETVVAPVVGEVDVTTANHHANRDAMSEFYLSILKPRVIIQEVWSSDHPGHETLLRMTSKSIWPEERDLFATNMLEANKLVIGELLERSYQCTQSHIVLRVNPNGDKYFVYTLNNNDTIREITGVYGPYYSKKNQN